MIANVGLPTTMRVAGSGVVYRPGTGATGLSDIDAGSIATDIAASESDVVISINNHAMSTAQFVSVQASVDADL